jgi:serralysin
VTILAGAGDDRILTGVSGATVTVAESGADTVIGGGGADYIHAGVAAASLSGGGGDDHIWISGPLQLGALMDGGAGADVLSFSGGVQAQPVVLATGHVIGFETLSIDEGWVTVEDGIGAAGAQIDVFATGEAGSTCFDASAVADVDFSMTGSQYDDTLKGGGGEDVLLGNYGHDTLFGGAGIDVLAGGELHDKLVGGLGADTLYGNGGADNFVYLATADSAPGAVDRILDLEGADTIDLKAIDADDKKAGNQQFHLVEAFDGRRGELVVSYDAGTDATTVAGDVDGDGQADLVIHIDGDHRDFTNFVL